MLRNCFSFLPLRKAPVASIPPPFTSKEVTEMVQWRSRSNTRPHFQESNFFLAHHGICVFSLIGNYLLLHWHADYIFKICIEINTQIVKYTSAFILPKIILHHGKQRRSVSLTTPSVYWSPLMDSHWLSSSVF